MNRRRGVLLLILMALGADATLPGAVAAVHIEPAREDRYVMGTALEITLYHPDARETRRLLDEAFAIAQGLDDLLSNYKPESELSRLNRKAGSGTVRISAELWDFLDQAKSLSHETCGAFDITVGPLMDLWQRASAAGRLPAEDSTKAARALVGTADLVLYLDGRAELKKRGMRLDTGGIGKGYAADRIADLFRRRGVDRALINFGHSSILALGTPPHHSTWKLLLQFPDEEPLGVLEIKDQALSASSSLGKSVPIDGKRYGHLVDPRTGTAVSQKIEAVVLAPTASAAEALSKFVILRDEPDIEGRDLWRDVKIFRLDEKGTKRQSEGFPFRPLSRLNPE